MSIMEILIRSISGYIFIIPGIILYFGALRKSAKRQILLHITTAFIFCYYLIGILTMTGIGKLKAFEPTLVLVPFRDMISGPIDTILNIILFVPLGFFLPLLYKKYGHIGSVALVSFLLSLSIEIVQMFGRGATDINDLITNTVGACLGFFIYQLLCKFVSKEFLSKFHSYKINERTELLLFILYSFVIMLTIQPIIISALFHLA
ncbi:VanZ family protein [Gemmiger formicilis]|uniref:VanZ family protein n=1 Tax=Gemmiger formicilis TaxID=745368 RepID=UPI0039F527CB